MQIDAPQSPTAAGLGQGGQLLAEAPGNLGLQQPAELTAQSPAESPHGSDDELDKKVTAAIEQFRRLEAADID